MKFSELRTGDIVRKGKDGLLRNVAWISDDHQKIVVSRKIGVLDQHDWEKPAQHEIAPDHIGIAKRGASDAGAFVCNRGTKVPRKLKNKFASMLRTRCRSSALIR